MATTEEELRRLERELSQMSMMTGAVRSAQSRLISTMTRHSDSVSKSIITTLQEIKGSSDNTKLNKKRLEVLQQQLQKTQEDLTTTSSRISALRSITTRTIEQEEELTELIAAEQRQKNEIDNLTDEIKAKTDELKYVKFQTLATTVTALAGGMMSLASSIRETQQRFGIVADQAAGLQFKNLKQSMSSYVDALTGTGPAATMEQIASTQEAFQQQFGGVLDPEAAKRLTQEAIKMGVTSEQMAEARRVFMTQTGGDLNKATAQTDKFIGEFKKKGLTAKDAMQAISQNSELLARNGTRFATAFARAAADAKKIGVDLSKVSQIGDNIIDDFEGFLESQASLGAMGFGFDSTRLAEIAATGDDAKLFTELRSQLAATGKDITKLSRPERLELEKAFGISISEMQKLATPAGKEGSGEKTMEQNQEDTNSLLTKAVSVLEGLGKAFAVIGSIISGTIAVSSLATSINTGIMAATLSAAVAGVFTGILSALTPLVAIGVAIAAIWGAVKLWKIGSKNVEEGKEKIKAGQEGGTSQLIKGRAQQGAGIGAGSGTVLGGLVAGALLTGTGVGATVGIPLMLAAMGAGAAAGGAGGGVIGAATGAVEAGNLKRTKGDDVISQPGYGKRSLVTPSGVIALNNRDNIIAYADDLMGSTKLPLGAITSQFAKLSEFEKRADKVFSGLSESIAGKFEAVKQSIGNIFGSSSEGLLGKFNKLKESGSGFVSSIKEGVLGKAKGLMDKFTGEGSMFSKAKGLFSGGIEGLKQKALGLASKIPGIGSLMGEGSLKEKAMGLASKIPGLGGIASKISGVGGVTNLISGFKQGGIKKGLTSLAGSGAGKAIGGAIGTLIPIPGVGTMLGSIAGGAISKGLGRLFGRKKQESPQVNPTIMSSGNIPNLATVMGSQTLQQNTTTTSQAPATEIKVDTAGIEQKLNNFINALQNIQINMDGNKVGKVLVNGSDSARTVGVFRQDARATL